MISPLKIHKVIQALPQEKTPNTMYLVRKGAGVEMRFTDNTGTADFGLNFAEIEMFASLVRLTSKFKIVVDYVEAVKGVWSIDLTSGGFTSKPFVFACAESTVANKNESSNYASVEYSTVTPTFARGRASNATAVGLLVGMVNTEGNCTVCVIAIGT